MISASFRVLSSVNRTYRLDSPPIMQGLLVLFACVGSGDPVRVLHLYTMNTLSTLWSIYYWDICTTCRYRIYVLRAQALRLWDFLLLLCTNRWLSGECTPTLYCVVAYIAACVDASRMVLWDRSQPCTPHEQPRTPPPSPGANMHASPQATMHTPPGNHARPLLTESQTGVKT